MYQKLLGFFSVHNLGPRIPILGLFPKEISGQVNKIYVQGSIYVNKHLETFYVSTIQIKYTMTHPLNC